MLNEIDLNRVDLNLLVLFEAVLAEGHVGRAGERLRLSPSAVSHGLGRLRRLLDDPLFLKTPRGVTPTARATALAPAIAEVLAGVRGVLASVEPFDPARSTRRFTLGAPDGASAVVLPLLLRRLERTAPGIDFRFRSLQPDAALPALDAGALDIAVTSIAEAPARFATALLYEERFVVVARAGHPFLAEPTLDRYCAAAHVLSSAAGDAHGFVDVALAREGRARRVAVSVPDALFGLAIVAETDLLVAMPRRLALGPAARLSLAFAELPVAAPVDPIQAVTSRAALADAGVAWLFGELGRLSDSDSGSPAP